MHILFITPILSTYIFRTTAFSSSCFRNKIFIFGEISSFCGSCSN